MPPLGEARNRFTLFIEGDALYDAMLAAIGNAHRRILLESYLFAADDVGQCFVAALVERARAGVEVRLMLDAVGSLLRFPRQVELQLREIGVAVRRFHRWRWRDTHLQVHGPLAAQAAVLFEAFWLDERWTPAAPAGAATVFCT